ELTMVITRIAFPLPTKHFRDAHLRFSFLLPNARYHPRPKAGIFPRFCRHTFRSPRPRLIVDRRTIADSRVHPPAVVVRDIAAHLPLELVLVREADAVDDVALHRVKE